MTSSLAGLRMDLLTESLIDWLPDLMEALLVDLVDMPAN